MDVLVHPDEEIFFVKQIVMEKATTDGKTFVLICFEKVDAKSNNWW